MNSVTNLTDQEQMMYTVMYALEGIEEDLHEGQQPNIKLVHRALKMINTLIKTNKQPDILKIHSEAYDKGYKAGANQKDNMPCVCGFWGNNKTTSCTKT